MPLLKKNPFSLIDPPSDLSPDEQVWQIRFTHEVFTDYSKYLERLNLFRQKVWTCKTTGKRHLTYEEALVSEQQAVKKLQQFPVEFKAFVLQNVQFSMLNITDLVAMLFQKLSDTFVQGEELLGKLENSTHSCRVLKVLVGKGGTSYEVNWLSQVKGVVSTSIVNKKNLTRKSFPLSRGLLKMFIKESTFQSNPWVVHNSLANKYGVPTNPPHELLDMISNYHSNNQLIVEKVVYPIEDLLVKPSTDDPVFTERPVPSVKFLVPMDIVGDLIMIWDFLSCFGKILHLSPFSLCDFEEAIVHEGISNLIAEAHVALLTLLIDEHGEYYSLIKTKKRNQKIIMKTWVQYLCDFLELDSTAKLVNHTVKIKSGTYSGLSVHNKLEILIELLHWATSTGTIKEQVDECIAKQQALIANKREEYLEELKKVREEKLLKKATSKPTSDSENIQVQTDLHGDADMEDSSLIETNLLQNCESKLEVLASRKANMKRSMEAKMVLDREKEAARAKEIQRLREESKARAREAKEKKLKKQRSAIFEREIDRVRIWTGSLGKDRDHNRYWFFQREGRIFVESADHKQWGFYSTKEELDGLMSSLNSKGERELALQRHLEKHYLKISSAFQKRSKEMVGRVVLEDAAINLRRSTRVSAPPKNDNKTPSFMQYVNTWRKQ